MKLQPIALLISTLALSACELEIDENTETEVEERLIEKEDTTGPILNTTNPTDKAEQVEVNSPINIYYNETLDLTIPNSTLQMRETVSGDLVEGALDIRGATLVFTPATKLKYETSYYLESDYEIADVIGNTIDTPLNISFTTQDAPILAIETPSADQTISGLAVITGTASKEVEQVLVSIADSGYVEANGTENWSLTVDTSIYNDGLTNIYAKATNGQWDISEQSLQVEIQNIDSLVGTWDWVSGNIGYSNAYIIFHESGVYDESNGTIFFNWARSWRRESENTITIQRSSAGPLTVTATVINDNLNLKWTKYSDNYNVNYKLR